MAQRITVTIPDVLHERLKVVKDRINVSGVCQEAIMKAVETAEIKLQNMPDIKDLLSRLHKEKEEREVLRMEREEEGKRTDASWKERGIQDGIKDAEVLSLGDFEEIVRLPLKDPKFGWILRERIRTKFLQGRLEDHKKTYKDFVARSYEDGWIEGVLEVWEQVKDKL